ncbi:GNAT family N-acetyltransferase [Bradyrhizobium septentrionale]|uniref:GNAT family N-acetyltransferase n=1 Tax=Bradyrhizobium septentrionale TaxID=1404411 RepID=A0A973VYT8_9BRAD|nr:GNAT family N-acetyltransferase [Bradyrhizobium septentrionale]UGY12924.1 GNAT family N-acetyltransferase [Bradyrhizobium septentrionale]UGY21467.1 GNAT family N-acetyltransferase [Bradyrhizobium septentrionale]
MIEQLIGQPKATVEYLADHPALVPTIAAWQHAQFGYLTPAATLEDRTERLRRSLQKDALPMAIVALSEDGTPLGSAGILAASITHKHLTPWLSSVYVPGEHRGQGIASALSLRAIDECAKLGFDRLYLFTPHSEAMYARLGWKTFQRIEYNGTPLTLMERGASLQQL